MFTSKRDYLRQKGKQIEIRFALTVVNSIYDMYNTRKLEEEIRTKVANIIKSCRVDHVSCTHVFSDLTIKSKAAMQLMALYGVSQPGLSCRFLQALHSSA